MSLHRDAPPSSEEEIALFDAMPLPGWVANADGWITYFNRAWYEYTGATPEQTLGWGWESFHDPSEWPAVLDAWRQALASGDPFARSFPLRGRDGVFRWFMTRATSVRDGEGRVVRWIGVHTDIDERKRIEAGLENAVQKREDLLAIVSHDLRNPLSTVLMAAKQIELFADESDSGARNRKAAQAVVRAVNQMTRLVGDLLDLARLQAEHPLRMELDDLDVAELVERAVESAAPVARARRLTLATSLPRGRLPARCDGDRVLQVLGNLIGNAIKFTLEGGTIRVEVREVDAAIVVSVSDTGAGIREDEVRHIFEPYWQADGQRLRGTGLGLSIVKAIVEAHDGRVWVESVLGSGTTFHFTLPGAAVPPAPKPA